MNKRAETVKFVVMTTAALFVMGMLFVIVGNTHSVTGKATVTNYVCYAYDGNQLSSLDVSVCCTEIRKSTGCTTFESNSIRDQLYICNDVVVNRNTIGFCE